MGKPLVKIQISEKGPGLKDLNALVADITRLGIHVRVGVLEGTSGGDELRGNEGIGNQAIGMGRIGVAHASKGISNAELAAVHEFGSKDGRIPERSFIRSTFDVHKAEYLTMLGKLLRRVFERNINVTDAFDIVGMKIASDIKKRVMQGEEVPPPNAPSTIARKTRKGAWNKKGLLMTGWTSRTLIDTGRMINSVTHAVYRGIFE